MSPLLLHAFGWRPLFYVFGVVGAPLLLFWQSVVPDAPLQQPQRSQAQDEKRQQQQQQSAAATAAAVGQQPTAAEVQGVLDTQPGSGVKSPADAGALLVMAALGVSLQQQQQHDVKSQWHSESPVVDSRGGSAGKHQKDYHGVVVQRAPPPVNHQSSRSSCDQLAVMPGCRQRRRHSSQRSSRRQRSSG